MAPQVDAARNGAQILRIPPSRNDEAVVSGGIDLFKSRGRLHPVTQTLDVELGVLFAHVDRRVQKLLHRRSERHVESLFQHAVLRVLKLRGGGIVSRDYQYASPFRLRWLHAL